MSVTKTRIEIPLSRCKFKTEKRSEEKEARYKMPEPSVKYYTFEQIKQMVKSNPEKFGVANEWILSNEIVKDVSVVTRGANLVMPSMTLTKNKHTFLKGYVTTHNLGFILQTLAKLFSINGVFNGFKNAPIRIVFHEIEYKEDDPKKDEKLARGTFFGNLLEDQFVYCAEIMSAGNEFFKPEFFGIKPKGRGKSGGNGGTDKGEGASVS